MARTMSGSAIATDLRTMGVSSVVITSIRDLSSSLHDQNQGRPSGGRKSQGEVASEDNASTLKYRGPRVVAAHRGRGRVSWLAPEGEGRISVMVMPCHEERGAKALGT
jgi:hypothetical protein